MKKNAINFIKYSLIGLLLLFCLQNIQGQSPCEGAAGIDREIFIDYPISSINLDELLAENSRVANNSNLVISSSWTFISGPVGPRGPRTVSISENDDVDFPNTGAGPDEEYVFEYTVTEDGCEDTAIITIWVFISDSSSEQQIIYTCPGETIGNGDELFNAFSLDQIRDTSRPWYPDQNFPEEDPNYDDPFYYEDFITPVSFPATIGSYIYFDNSFNKLKATIQEIACSDLNINFSFANAQTTNDGTNDYFEVDVMIQSTGAGSSFKLGDGKLFFRYNPVAFGNYISANNRIEITHPDGYIAGQSIDSNPSEKIYGNFITLDNTNEGVTDRVSWGFKQNYSSTLFNADNVDETPRKLCHLKLTYIDNTQPAFLEFAENESLQIYDNQFTDADQNSLIVNDAFENNGATLSSSNIEAEDISLYPNPVKDILSVKGDISDLKAIEIYSISGRQIVTLFDDFNNINTSQMQAGMYFVKLRSENASKTVKIIKN